MTDEEDVQGPQQGLPSRYLLRKTSARGFGGKGLEPRLSCESAGEGCLNIQTYAVVHE